MRARSGGTTVTVEWANDHQINFKKRTGGDMEEQLKILTVGATLKCSLIDGGKGEVKKITRGDDNAHSMVEVLISNSGGTRKELSVQQIADNFKVWAPFDIAAHNEYYNMLGDNYNVDDHDRLSRGNMHSIYPQQLPYDGYYYHQQPQQYLPYHQQQTDDTTIYSVLLIVGISLLIYLLCLFVNLIIAGLCYVVGSKNAQKTNNTKLECAKYQEV